MMRVMLFIVTIMSGLLSIGPALAAVHIETVLADVIGSSPVDAQQKAIDYAKKRAFFLVLSRLSPDKAVGIAESLSTTQIDAHIRGYELLHDKTDSQNPNHYIAEYKISISKDMVERLLSGDGADAPLEVNPTLVLPVLRDGDKILLWEADNIWRSIWNSVALERGEAILVMPYGDPKDILLTDSSTVLTFDFTQFKEMAARYGAGEVVVVQAELLRDKTPPALGVVLRRFGPNLNKAKTLYFETDSNEETVESLLPEAARSIADQLKDIAKNYQGETLRKIAQANKISLVAPLKRLNDWVALQKRLSDLPNVVKIDVTQVNIGEARATLFFDTKPEVMQQIMKANGLFVDAGSDVWTVYLP